MALVRCVSIWILVYLHGPVDITVKRVRVCSGLWQHYLLTEPNGS